MKIKYLTFVAAIALMASACTQKKTQPVEQPQPKLMDKYAEYTLTSDISHLSENEKEMLLSEHLLCGW